MTKKEALEIIKTYFKVTMDFIGGEDKETENAIKVIKQALKRLDDLEKIIEDIKQLPNCDICDREMYKGCSCLKKKIKKLLKGGVRR